jgi:hypothetical protein
VKYYRRLPPILAPAEKEGIPGTLIFSKQEPLSSDLDLASRSDMKAVITAEYDDFFWSMYTPPIPKISFRDWITDGMMCFDLFEGT